MGITMTLLVKVILILALHQSRLDSNILDDTNVKLSLQYLCPGVDICNRNESDPKVNPKDIDERGYTSCCHSCSCHTNCHLSMNCCFPGGIEVLPNSNTSSTFENGKAHIEQGNVSLPIYRNNSLRKEDSVLENTKEVMRATTNETTDISREVITVSTVTRAVNKEDMTVANDNVSIDRDLAVKQCMYARTGTPNQFWAGRVPVYIMTSSPPPVGCKPNIVCPLLTQQNKQATCNSEDFFTWGDLFPVYSTNQNLIFKNELCACCYGVLDYKPWMPFLECDQYDSTNQRNIPISEHLRFLEQSNALSNHCMVVFHNVDTPVLLENQCYMNTIGTCRFSADFVHRVPDGVNLTNSEIVEACKRGPDAPFILKRSDYVYKNVFCAMCNLYLNVDSLQCISGDAQINKNFGKNKFTHLLDTNSIQKTTQEGKKGQVSLPPMACLKDNGVWIDDSCRAINCPSGQTRIGGVCAFPSKKWFLDGFKVTVNLKYVTSNTPVFKTIKKEEGMTDEIVKAFIKTNPWPSVWSIITIYHTTEEYQFTPHMAVELFTEISRPKMLSAQIKASMRLQWNIELNGMDIAFEQSFLQYRISRNGGRNGFVPRWLRYRDEVETYINVPDNALTFWDRIWYDLNIIHPPQPLNKLLICEQISLLKNEYTIMASGLMLMNRLTNESMFSQEFDIFEDVDGDLDARICLNDSPFALRREKNGASTMSIIILNLVCVMHLLHWTIKLSGAPVIFEYR